MICFMVVLGLVTSPLLIATPTHADKLSEAIAKTPRGTEKGQIDPKAEPGFLGIPGAPSANYIVGLLWAIWVGWIFSTLGSTSTLSFSLATSSTRAKELPSPNIITPAGHEL